MAEVQIEHTPNPNSHRFLVDRRLQEQPRGRMFRRGDDVDDPLAGTLLQIEGVETVMLLPDSVTVTKADGVEWETLDEVAKGKIEDHLG